jgi:hypothetical protein
MMYRRRLAALRMSALLVDRVSLGGDTTNATVLYWLESGYDPSLRPINESRISHASYCE